MSQDNLVYHLFIPGAVGDILRYFLFSLIQRIPKK